jgi:hypothetical protein
MSITEIKKALVGTFQGMLKNIVSLANDSTLEKDYKVLKVGEKNTPIEISEDNVKINNSDVLTKASSLNDLSDVSYSDGDLNISGVDKVESNGDLYIEAGRDLIFNSSRNTACANDFLLLATKKLYFDSGFDTYIEEQSADLLNVRVGGVDLLAIKESAATSAAQSSIVFTGCPIQLKDIGGVADTPGSGYGSLYVNSDELFYKNDSGTINRLDTASKFFLNVGCYYATSAKKWLPLAQGEYDQSTYPIDYATDNANFVVPYDMKINTIYVNHNRSTSGNAQPGNTDIQLYKGGTAYSGNVTVDIDGSGYNSTNTAVVYTFDFSGETNEFAAGEVMAISLDPTSTAYWFAITICGEYV